MHIDPSKKSLTSQRDLSVQFIRYTLASAVALVVDYGMYWALAGSGILPQPIAAVAGYMMGVIIAYYLMAGRVFEGGWLMHRKSLEVLLFFASGLFGAFLTFATVSFYVRFIEHGIHGAKIAAIGVSFVGVYLFRKILVFRKPA